MKLFIVLSLVALAVAAPQSRSNDYYKYNDAQILRYDSENYGTGGYSYGFEQTDGTKAEQQGELRNAGSENEYIAVRGSFTWIGPDGVKYTVTYVADDKGYQPEIEEGPGGAIPPAVVASLLG